MGTLRDSFPQLEFSELVDSLEREGVTLEDLLSSSERNLSCLRSFFPSAIIKFRFKSALKRKREEVKQEFRPSGDILDCLKCYVGRVSAEFSRTHCNAASCVLVRSDGAALTALHVVQMSHRVSRNVKIQVTFPCALQAPISYSAVIEDFSEELDLVLLRPQIVLDDRFLEGLRFFNNWSTGYGVNDEVVLLSYPNLIDETVRQEGQLDIPSIDFGRVTFGSHHEGCASYRCFPGSSGGLVVSVRTRQAFGLHVEQLGDHNETGTSKENCLQKCSYAVFCPLAAHFLTGKRKLVEFNRRGKELRSQQVDAQQVQTLDLFGLWEGLDDPEDFNPIEDQCVAVMGQNWSEDKI